MNGRQTAEATLIKAICNASVFWRNRCLQLRQRRLALYAMKQSGIGFRLLYQLPCDSIDSYDGRPGAGHIVGHLVGVERAERRNILKNGAAGI